MANTLLISPAPENADFYANTLPPLGILYIAAFLEKQGEKVDICDLNINDEINIDVTKYDIIGISIHAANITSALRLIASLKMKSPDAKIVVGGPSCIANPEFFKSQENIDAICEAEGEHALLEYIKTKSYINRNPVHGMYVQDMHGNFSFSGKREYLSDLDSLPFPAFEKVDIKKYRVPISKAAPISSIITSRGCPYDCIFCFHAMGHKCRVRSAENVVKEISWQVNVLGVKEICIQDDNFSLDINRVKLICDKLIEKNVEVKLQLQNGIRVDCVDQELVQKMSKAGVWLLGVAPETGSKRIMDMINKKISFSKIKEVLMWCNKAGINTFSYFLIGFPFENRDDIEKTKSFIQELDTDFMQLARVIPFPSTVLYDSVKDQSLEHMFSTEQNCFSGTLPIKHPNMTEEEIIGQIKEIHRRFYMRPGKIYDLVKILPINTCFRLFMFILKTKNM